MRFQSYFNTAIKIIQLYDGSLPLQHFLKQYFAQYKKHGSKDRKAITHLCYNFFRLGKSFSDISIEERLKLAIFICNDNIEEWHFLYEDEWLKHHHTLLSERIAFIKTNYVFEVEDVFPFHNESSNTVNIDAFTKSFLIQPDVFLRIRPGFKKAVLTKLQQHNIPYTIMEENCISLSPAVNIHTIIDVDKEAVIQDYSSQQVKNFLELVETETNPQSAIANRQLVWDCCCGSGGKSILAYDALHNIQLTVSDIRASIIQNLKQRFAKAGIKNYKSFVYDAANSKSQIPGYAYNLIICDAPCTGSGTWGRTPEQLYFFNATKIAEYTSRQQKIVSHAVEALQPGAYFLYITCSVFKKENEDVVAFLQQNFQLELIKMELITGYDKKADTMFAALLKNTRK